MDVVLRLTCQHCKQQLMDQRTSFAPGSSAKIYIDEYTRQFGPCCTHPARMVSVEVVEPDKTVEASEPAKTITIEVKSVVISYLDDQMEVKDQAGNTHIIALDETITVTMTGHPERETVILPAEELGDYMTDGYIIEQISYENEKGN